MNRFILLAFLLLVLEAALIPNQARAADPSPANGGSSGSVSFNYSDCKTEISDISPEKRVVDKEIEGPLQIWLTSSLSWQITYWILLAGSILFSSVAASGLVADAAPAKLKSIFALVATLASALLATFNPQARADQYMDGYVYLKSAIVRFHHDGNMSACNLAAAYSAAESLVHHRNPPSAVGPSK